MTSQLPFTLAPLDGEPFGVWLHAYAARLTLAPGHLAGKLGLPCPSRGPAARPAPAQLDAVCAAAGLPPEAVSGMLTACGPSPPAQLLRAWMPQRATRFCPACLAEDPARMPAAWRLPVTFFCLPHGQVLASNCPHCGRRPASLARPSLPAHCGGPGGCGGLLAAASPPPCADVPATRQAQEAISQLLAGIRDPAATAARRRQSLDQLTDVITIAFHLAATTGGPRPARSLTPGMLDASTLTSALALLAAQPGTPDPLAALASGTTPGTTAPAIPGSWRTASPALRARIAHPRDPWLHPVDRLRYATTLPAPRAPAPRPPGHPDPAAARAARLPDQIWADWAIRLTDASTARHDRFRSSALAALLLPHSGMSLQQITALISGQLKRHVTSYQMSKLTGPGTGPAALRILTELALALDARDIPVSYKHRRDLAASTTLIGDTTWARMVRDAGLRADPRRHAQNACRYLYELLTGCSLRTAPPPYQVTTASAQAGYNTFTISMTTDLASALDDHARRLLAIWGITSEPLQWQPPATWVTATTWPGADPAETDPAPVHRALLRDHAPPARIAASLGISIDHLRQVLRHHPLPRPLHPARRTPAPAIPPADAPPGQPGLDPAWLREEYHTWRRPLEDIASQTGYPAHALSRLARANGIPIRPRGSSGFTAPGYHPRDLPEPLRQALTGCHPQQRLQRLLAIAEHVSISQAARALGISQAAIHTQLVRLEHTCGSPLIHRQPGSRAPATLTPLGEQLCQQARDYLGLTAASPGT